MYGALWLAGSSTRWFFNTNTHRIVRSLSILATPQNGLISVKKKSAYKRPSCTGYGATGRKLHWIEHSRIFSLLMLPFWWQGIGFPKYRHFKAQICISIAASKGKRLLNANDRYFQLCCCRFCPFFFFFFFFLFLATLCPIVPGPFRCQLSLACTGLKTKGSVPQRLAGGLNEHDSWHWSPIILELFQELWNRSCHWPRHRLSRWRPMLDTQRPVNQGPLHLVWGGGGKRVESIPEPGTERRFVQRTKERAECLRKGPRACSCDVSWWQHKGSKHRQAGWLAAWQTGGMSPI